MKCCYDWQGLIASAGFLVITVVSNQVVDAL
jgi:hypothetical protein